MVSDFFRLAKVLGNTKNTLIVQGFLSLHDHIPSALICVHLRFIILVAAGDSARFISGFNFHLDSTYQPNH